MGYVEVEESFLDDLRLRLTGGGNMVLRYLNARKEWHQFQDGYNLAHQKYEGVRRELADLLLQIYQDVDRIEHHKKGEAL